VCGKFAFENLRIKMNEWKERKLIVMLGYFGYISDFI